MLVVLEGAGACLPALDRSDGVGSGGILLRVVDEVGVAVAGAVASADGTLAMATSDADGHVGLRRLLPADVVVRVDVRADDGSLAAGAVIANAGVALAPIVRSAAVGPLPGLTSQLLGDVVVHRVGSLGGRVDVAACTPGSCRVVVARRLELGTATKRPVLAAVEAGAPVADDGSWAIAAVVPGELVVALLHATWPATGSSVVDVARAASRPDAFAVVDVSLGVDTPYVDVALPALQPLAPTTALDVELAGDVGDPTRAAGLVRFLAPSTNVDATSDPAAFADLGDAHPVVAPLQAATGLFDLSVQLDDGVTGRARGVLALPRLPPPAPIVLGALDVCDVTAANHDCDGDGVAGSRDDDDNSDGIDDDDQPRPCNAADPERDCDGDGRPASRDPDDDGDGQPDVTETAPCRGPGRGTDVDGDCLCEPFDPLPACPSNDPAACAVATPVVCPA
jgi:hypothetical protein